MCPKQRIIFASAYVQETLIDSITSLKQIVELLQKPFTLQAMIDTIEDKEIYAELEKLNVTIRNLKVLNPTHAQIRDYLNALKQLQKGKTFWEFESVDSYPKNSGIQPWLKLRIIPKFCSFTINQKNG